MFLIIGKVSYLILVTNTTFNYSIKFFRTKYFNLLCLLSLLFQQFYPQKKKIRKLIKAREIHCPCYAKRGNIKIGTSP